MQELSGGVNDPGGYIADKLYSTQTTRLMDLATAKVQHHGLPQKFATLENPANCRIVGSLSDQTLMKSG